MYSIRLIKMWHSVEEHQTFFNQSLGIVTTIHLMLRTREVYQLNKNYAGKKFSLDTERLVGGFGLVESEDYTIRKMLFYQHIGGTIRYIYVPDDWSDDLLKSSATAMTGNKIHNIKDFLMITRF